MTHHISSSHAGKQPPVFHSSSSPNRSRKWIGYDNPPCAPWLRVSRRAAGSKLICSIRASRRPPHTESQPRFLRCFSLFVCIKTFTFLARFDFYWLFMMTASWKKHCIILLCVYFLVYLYSSLWVIGWLILQCFLGLSAQILKKLFVVKIFDHSVHFLIVCSVVDQRE